jgi:cellulose synthase/poly-beta-1,6-N-acetylglucosamine synthase-like glycosyltransferase
VISFLGWFLPAVLVALGVYAYVGYPLILRVLPRHPPAPPRYDWAEWPLVSIVVPAFNEEHQIRGAIEAILAQTYPADRRQILILSDASTDRTDEIVGEYADRGVELMRMPKRAGKTAAENASCSLIRGSIVLNTDASIRLHPDCVRQLVAHMADPSVGVASSRDVSIADADMSANEMESGYVGYEMMVRRLETTTGGIVGASGSGYAIRRELHFIPIREDLSRDFSAALTARSHGFIAISVDEAICYVPRTASLAREYKRKVRTISRGMDTLKNNAHLMDVERYGVFAWKLISHKVLRWSIPHAALPGLLGLVLLSTVNWLDTALVLGALGVGGLTLIVAHAPFRTFPRPISIIAFGVAANAAVVHASWRFMHGHEDHIWEPTRRAGPADTADVR